MRPNSSYKPRTTKKYFHVAILTLLLPTVGSSQAMFQKTYGSGNASALTQTADGGFIMAGYCGSFGSPGVPDCRLIKTDLYGDTLWTRTYGTSQSDYPHSVLETADKGYLIAGGIQNSSTILYLLFLIKTDSIGNIYWSKTYKPTNSKSIWAKAVLKASDGGYIVGGTTNFKAGYADACLLKIDTIGNVQWSKSYGGSSFDGGDSFQSTIDGGYIIAGYTGNFGAGSTDIYVVKTDASGTVQWSKTYGGSKQEEGLSIQQTSDSGYVICGHTKSFGAGSEDFYVIKTDANGGLLWSKTYGGTNSDKASFVKQTSDGGYIIGGTTFSFGAGLSDAYIVRANSIGDIIWTRTMGDTTNDYGNLVEQTSDAGFIVAGSNNNNAYLIKTDANGSSGCNEKTTATIVTSPITQTTSPSTVVWNSSTSPANLSLSISSGGTITTNCFVGVNEILVDEGKINVYPNPATDYIMIGNYSGINNMRFRIYNSLGEMVFEQPDFHSTGAKINLANLSSGIYFVKIFDKKSSYSKKFIVAKD